jgi:hypothetical protein
MGLIYAMKSQQRGLPKELLFRSLSTLAMGGRFSAALVAAADVDPLAVAMASIEVRPNYSKQKRYQAFTLCVWY